jgi:hypothetical protein
MSIQYNILFKCLLATTRSSQPSTRNPPLYIVMGPYLDSHLYSDPVFHPQAGMAHHHSSIISEAFLNENDDQCGGSYTALEISSGAVFSVGLRFNL